jgi:hypothetical protein
VVRRNAVRSCAAFIRLYILFDNKPEFEGTAKKIFEILQQKNDPD